MRKKYLKCKECKSNEVNIQKLYSSEILFKCEECHNTWIEDCNKELVKKIDEKKKKIYLIQWDWQCDMFHFHQNPSILSLINYEINSLKEIYEIENLNNLEHIENEVEKQELTNTLNILLEDKENPPKESLMKYLNERVFDNDRIPDFSYSSILYNVCPQNYKWIVRYIEQDVYIFFNTIEEIKEWFIDFFELKEDSTTIDEEYIELLSEVDKTLKEKGEYFFMDFEVDIKSIQQQSFIDH